MWQITFLLKYVLIKARLGRGVALNLGSVCWSFGNKILHLRFRVQTDCRSRGVTNMYTALSSVIIHILQRPQAGGLGKMRYLFRTENKSYVWQRTETWEWTREERQIVASAALASGGKSETGWGLANLRVWSGRFSWRSLKKKESEGVVLVITPLWLCHKR